MECPYTLSESKGNNSGMAPAKQPPVRKRGSRFSSGADGEKLPYRIELWDGEAVDRTLALAGNANLARAIYTAAAAEYPGRIIVLSRGSRVLARNPSYQES
jgi:hypothetical protein